MIDAVIFDLDGTVVEQRLDFDAIRAEMGITGGEPILESLEKMSPDGRRQADAVLARHEQDAARRASLAQGAQGLFEYLAEQGIPVAILTRNARRSVETVLRRFGLKVDCIVAREDATPKPHPDGVLTIARKLGVAPARCLVVGDFQFDVEAGRAAGARTVLVQRPGAASCPVKPDHVVASLDELRTVLQGLVGG